MAHYVMSEVSPKEFDKFSHNTKEELKRNYAEQFARRLKKAGSYYQVFETVYGSNWHKQSYKKLLQLAKMLPTPSVEYRQGYKYSFCESDKLALFFNDDINQSIFARKVSKLYGKNAMQWLENNRNYLGRERHFRDAVIEDCKNIIKVHNYIATNLKDIKADYVSKAKKDFQIAWNMSMTYDEFRKGTKDTILMGDLGNEVLEQHLRATFNKQCNSNCYSDSISTLTAGICSNIISEANSTRYYDASSRYGMKRRKALQRGIHNLQQVKEFNKLLDELGLEVTQGYCNGRRLNGKLLSALKSISRAKVGGDAKRDTAMALASQLNHDNYNRNIYSPILSARKESK